MFNRFRNSVRRRSPRVTHATVLMGLAALVACGRDDGLAPDDAASNRLAAVCTLPSRGAELKCESASAPANGSVGASVVRSAGGVITVVAAAPYVRLRAGTPVYSGSQATVAVTLQNLLAQPLGTSDGATGDVNGVRLVVHNLPAGVTLANAQGTSNGAPYLAFPGPIPANGTSAPRTFVFNDANNFSRPISFAVLLEAAVPNPSPSAVTPPASAFTNVTAGALHSCAIRVGGAVYCWGSNGFLQLGTPTGSSAVPLGALGAPAVIGATRVAAGTYHTCALSGGRAYCWGSNSNGQAGTGSVGGSVPVAAAVVAGQVPAGVTFTDISLGANHTCALGSNGAAYCWGSDSTGQLGTAGGPSTGAPQVVQPGAVPAGVSFTQVAAGTAHSCAIGTDGAAYCWGANNAGQLGTGSVGAPVTTPVRVAQGAIPAGVTLRRISAGYAQSCALGSDGRAYCWGDGSFGALGNGVAGVQPAPVAVASGDVPAGVTFTQLDGGISAGSGYSACVLGSDGAVYCWGFNRYGTVGDGTTTTATTPRRVVSGEVPSGVTFRQVSVGGYHACGLGSNGIGYCWGLNTEGELGNGTVTPSSPVPTRVSMP